MRSMRHALDIWPVGLMAARRNIAPIFLFIIMSMLFAGAAEKMQRLPMALLIIWACGMYAAAIVLISAARTAASQGAESGLVGLGAAGGSHAVALRALVVALVGFVGGVLALNLLAGPPPKGAEKGFDALGAVLEAQIAAVGPIVAAVIFASLWSLALLALGRGIVRVAAKGLEARPAAPGGVFQAACAFALGPTPLGALALWLDFSLPSAKAAGGYWTAAHAFGEVGLFGAAALALIFAGVALENGLRETRSSGSP
ncbi:MAG: hypothetical protein MRY74_09825 [Neomegalonema sp.]|nr:hypothetical protein [Neomegalonema sp.]